MDAGAKSRFDKAAEALNVDPTVRETMWRRIGDLQLSPDDPTVVFLAVAGVLEKAASDIPTALAAFPQKMQDAVNEALVPLATAATAATAAAAAARPTVADEIAKSVKETKSEVRQAATLALQEISNRRDGRRSFHYFLGLCLAATLGVASGYAAGRVDQAGIRRGVEALALRADAESWVSLIRANTDLARSLRENCSAGGKGAYLVQGARACALPLWLDAPPGAPASAGGHTVTILSWIDRLPTAVWVALGVAGGFLIRRVILEFGRQRSVRWLLEL